MKHCKGTLKELLEDRDLVVNTLIMSVIWSVTSFTYYLGKFQLKYVAGNVYRNSVFSSIADTVARPIGYVLYRKTSAKVALIAFFFMQAAGSFPVIFSEFAKDYYSTYVVPACLFIMNMGTSSTFGSLYMGHMDLFPVVFSSTTMGLCNVLARFVTIFAPMLAEVPQPTPEIVFTTLSIGAAILSFFIRKKTDKYY